MAPRTRNRRHTKVQLIALGGLMFVVASGCSEAQQAKAAARRTGHTAHQWFDHARDRVTGRTDPRLIPEPQPEVLD